MKKTLIAIAALAATGAFAQSTVTIDGIVDAGYVQSDVKGIKISGIASNLTSTSQINFRVASDLGGGMKATFRSETDWSPVSNGANTGTTAVVTTTNAVGSTGSAITAANTSNGTQGAFGNGEQKLALSGAFGEAAFGAINNTALAAHGTSQPFGTALGSGFVGPVGGTNGGAGLGNTGLSGSVVTASVRNDNSFQYTTPSFAGGLKINYIFRKAQGATAITNNANYSTTLGAQNQGGVSSLAALYSVGPMNVILTRDTQDQTGVNTVSGKGVVAAGNRGTYTALAANYNMGAVTVYGGYQTNVSTNAAGAEQENRKTFNIAAQYVMGVNTFMANIARGTNNFGATPAPAPNLVGMGYEYALSKTAALTARYERVSGDQAGWILTSGLTGATNNDRTRMGVGLRVGF